MVPWDVRLQYRYGFYAVYAIVTVLSVLLVHAVGPAFRTRFAVLLIVMDPTALGFYFIAALVLFERREGVLDALVVTPLGDRGYLLSKVLTLAFLATLVSTLVAVGGHGLTDARLLVLVAGVALSSSFFVLAGFVAVARFDSVNEYFLSAIGWGTVLFVPPLVGYLGIADTPLFYFFPMQSVLLLVEGGFSALPAWQLVYGVGYLLAANSVAFVWARRSFRRHVVRGGDPGRQLGRASRADDEAGAQPIGDGRFARSPWLGMAVADLRNWLRDPLLSVSALAPFALALVVRFGLPRLAVLVEPVVDLTLYYPVIVGTIAAFGPYLYGFVVGMFVLEDREQGVLAAFRTTPLSGRGYLAYRAATAYAIGFATTIPALAVVGLVHVPLVALLGTAACAAFAAPVIAILFGSVATNTIEGLAISKLLNAVVFAPAVAIALAPAPFQFLAGVVPTYWPIEAFVAAAGGDPVWPVYLLVGVAVHALVAAPLYRHFSRRAD